MWLQSQSGKLSPKVAPSSLQNAAASAATPRPLLKSISDSKIRPSGSSKLSRSTSLRGRASSRFLPGTASNVIAVDGQFGEPSDVFSAPRTHASDATDPRFEVGSPTSSSLASSADRDSPAGPRFRARLATSQPPAVAAEACAGSNERPLLSGVQNSTSTESTFRLSSSEPTGASSSSSSSSRPGTPRHHAGRSRTPTAVSVAGVQPASISRPGSRSSYKRSSMGSTADSPKVMLPPPFLKSASDRLRALLSSSSMSASSTTPTSSSSPSDVGIGARSNSLRQMKSDGDQHRYDGHDHTARHRWKEGILMVMAVNRFHRAAVDRRARLAQTAEAERRKRILRDRSAARAKLGTSRHGISMRVGAAVDVMLHGWSNPSRITEYLWLGGTADANDLARLTALGITHVLNTAQQAPEAHKDEFMYLKLPLLDHPDEDITSSFLPAFAHIADARECGGAVLVHCVAGMSRSVAITAAWMVQHEGLSLKHAMDAIRARRPVALPNVGFRLALAKHEVSISGGTSVSKQHHDPMWNFAQWRAIQDDFRIRPDDGRSISDVDGAMSDAPACCCIS